MEQEMEYIYRIYQCKSFSKAAAELYMTQPALSLAVRRVEEAIGAKLFDRNSRSLTLTEAGELYIRKYHEIRNLEKELHQQLQDLSSLQTGTLHIGGTNFFNSYILPPVIVSFMEKYPGIELKMSEAGSYDLLQMLQENRIDLTFNCGLTFKDPYLRTPCFEDMILLCVPKSFDLPESVMSQTMNNEDILAGSHRSGTFSPVPLSEFENYPFILLSEGNNLYERTQTMLAREKCNVTVRLKLTQLATAWHLSSSGLGITFISDRLVTDASTSVRFFLIDSPLAVRKFDLVMSERRYVSYAMKAFEKEFTGYYMK